jgi:hypothetical protein
VRLESISLKHSDSLNQGWVQAQIAEDPSILDLGDLVLKDKERMQPGAGRLDLLLQDPLTFKRYEVEIQLVRRNRRESLNTCSRCWLLARSHRYPGDLGFEDEISAVWRTWRGNKTVPEPEPR